MLVDVKAILSRPIVPKVLCFTLVFLLLWQVTASVGSFFSITRMPTVGSSINEIKAETKRNSTTAQNTPFFGDYVPNNLNDADVKQSMLDLTVVGIMFSNDEKNSHVIIRTAGNGEKSFAVGDSLPGGAIIKRITPDGVLIRRNGALESLSLPKSSLTFEPPAKPLGVSN